MNGSQAIAASLLFSFLVAATAEGQAQSGEVSDSAQTEENSTSVELLVYKKWIGAAGDEANVEIHLSCGPEDEFEPRYINRDKPGGWEIARVPTDGMLCSVREIERDTFVADVGDCLDLLVLPGQEAECTLVNTKVVKRIDMLNRYGVIIMIAVMLGAGLAGVRTLGGRI